MRLSIFPAILWLFVNLLPLGAQRPEKIVSLSSTGDNLLEIFVTPDRVIALSPSAWDKQQSTVSSEYLLQVPRPPLSVPEILELKPDLVLVDWETPQDTLLQLRQGKIITEILKEPLTWDDVRVITLRIARVVKADPSKILDIMHNGTRALQKDYQAWSGAQARKVAIFSRKPLSKGETSFFKELLSNLALNLVDPPTTAGSFGDAEALPQLYLFPSVGNEASGKFLPLPVSFLNSRGPEAIKKIRELFEILKTNS